LHLWWHAREGSSTLIAEESDLGGFTDFFADVDFFADFVGADFVGADFVGADFVGADFVAADFVGADFVGADFVGADFVGADFVGADFVAADFVVIAVFETDFFARISFGADFLVARKSPPAVVSIGWSSRSA
jgi:uncharacterized protein YjbI with pentapeptide repeats